MRLGAALAALDRDLRRAAEDAVRTIAATLRR